jgi:hypothetical protein
MGIREADNGPDDREGASKFSIKKRSIPRFGPSVGSRLCKPANAQRSNFECTEAQNREDDAKYILCTLDLSCEKLFGFAELQNCSNATKAKHAVIRSPGADLS